MVENRSKRLIGRHRILSLFWYENWIKKHFWWFVTPLWIFGKLDLCKKVFPKQVLWLLLEKEMEIQKRFFRVGWTVAAAEKCTIHGGERIKNCDAFDMRRKCSKSNLEWLASWFWGPCSGSFQQAPDSNWFCCTPYHNVWKLPRNVAYLNFRAKNVPVDFWL